MAGNKACLIVPVNCSCIALSAPTLPFSGAILNTASAIAAEMNTEASANNRPEYDELSLILIRRKTPYLSTYRGIS